MFEQDYIMRIVKEMIRTILKLLFNIDTESPSAELLKDTDSRKTLDDLMDKVDRGLIDEAETDIDVLTNDHENSSLEIALLFYSYLNEKDEEFLEDHGYDREKVRSGLINIAEKYGISHFAELFI